MVYDVVRRIEETMKEGEGEKEPLNDLVPTPYHYFKLKRNSTTKGFPDRVEYKTGSGVLIERDRFKTISDPSEEK